MSKRKRYNKKMTPKISKIVVLLFSVVIFISLAILIINKSTKNTIINDSSISTSSKVFNSTTTTKISESVKPLQHYIEIVNGCGPYYNLTPCINMRSGPGVEYPVVSRLRNGIVLKVEDTNIVDGAYAWHKVIFDKEIRYPERVVGDWYVAVDEKSVISILNIGDEIYKTSTPTTSKKIIVELSNEMLYAYDGDTLFMNNPISTGLNSTPTSIGDFKILFKTPSRYMQGPIKGVSDQYYDLPGVPWDLYFTNDGDVIHGAYWHDNFGKPWSHGCVNLPPEKSKELYMWADIGTTVTIKE